MIEDKFLSDILCCETDYNKILIDNDLNISEIHFKNAVNKIIWKTIKKLEFENMEISLFNVVNESLKTLDIKKDTITNKLLIGDGDILYSAKELISQFNKHNLQQIINKTVTRIRENNPIENTINELKGDIENLSIRAANDCYKTPDLEQYIPLKINKDFSKGSLPGLKLNRLYEIQERIEGLQAGLTLIGGDSNAGKTKLINNLAYDILESNEDTYVLFISLDDSINDVINNLVSIDSYKYYDKDKGHFQLSQNQVKSPSVLDEIQMLIYSEAYANIMKYANKRLNIMDAETIQSYKIMRFHIDRKVKKYKDKKLVIAIDGIYNLDVSDSVKSTDNRIQNIARFNYLKQICDIYNIPILCTVELNKRKHMSKYIEPQNHDIMETSKAIYNAKLIMLICYNDQNETENNIIFNKLKFTKNKFSEYKGSLYYKFDRKKGFCVIDNSEDAKNYYRNSLTINKRTETW